MKRTSGISLLVFSALLFVVMIICLYPQVSYADAPQDLKLEYNTSTQNLAVTITHKSAFTGFHRIKNIEIKKNSTVLSATNYDSQPSETPFTYSYKVAAKAGDKLEVIATCSLSGSKTVVITIPAASK